MIYQVVDSLQVQPKKVVLLATEYLEWFERYFAMVFDVTSLLQNGEPELTKIALATNKLKKEKI